MVCPACGATNDDAAEVCFTCREVLAALTRGSVVAGRYEVLSLLGRGGMGTVYKARDQTLDEVVALKVLRSEIARAPQMAERFRSEIRLARRVGQRNVCRIHEYGEEAGLCYIAMEWIEGTNLKQALKERGGLPAKEAFEVSLQVAEGLRAIHEAGIIHRDLTTPNIMLGADGVARILDFGIAKRVVPDGATHPTTAGYVLGSPEYMSPEQARGRPVDYRTDIYSFGVVLFEIVTGRVPFRAETPVATLLLHVETPPPLEGAAIPTALVPVLRRALAKGPQERYPRAADLIEALRGAQAETLGGTRLPDRSDLDRSETAQLPRRPGAAWTGLALALVALAGVLASRWSRSPAMETPSSPTSGQRGVPADQTGSPSPTATRRTSSRAASTEPAKSASPAPAEVPSGPPTVASPDAAEIPPAPTLEPAAPGVIRIAVTPWADVSLDQDPIGQTPMADIRVSPGSHSLVLTHPDYQPYRRVVRIRSGETLRLIVHLETDGVRKRP